MSLSGVGAHSGAGMAQMLLSLLNKLDTSTTDGSNADLAVDPADTATSTRAESGKMQGRPTPNVSSMVLGTLIGLQQQSSNGSTSASGDPVQSLFTAMDADGDGVVSKTELESHITALGGTAKQADTLFGKLAGDNSSNGISEQDLANAVPLPPPGYGSGPDAGHRVYGAMLGTSGQSGSQLSLAA